ncbi:MAG: alanine racemase [Planctomycetes bacterium]|nr:alanine racemase [Planctomycetota bacterium]
MSNPRKDITAIDQTARLRGANPTATGTFRAVNRSRLPLGSGRPTDAIRSVEDVGRGFGHLLAEIDQDAIVHNCNVLRSRVPSTSRFCVAVKANAYGHGFDIVLPALARAGVDMVAVATVTEAQQIRDLGWDQSILLLGTELSIYQGSLKRDVARWLVEHEIRVTVLSQDDLDAFSAAANSTGKAVRVHLKLDTGLSRMGVDEDTVMALIEQSDAMSGVTIEGLYTHFASADEVDCGFAKEQLARFLRFVERTRRAGRDVPTLHAANSAAICNMPESALDLVRPGIGIYGYQTGVSEDSRVDLKPAMRVVSHLMLIKNVPAGSDVGYGRRFTTKRDSVLGIVPIGYADGLDRRLSNAGWFSVAGKLAPVVGMISMDQTIIDLTDVIADGNVQTGSRVIVIDNDPSAPNCVEQLARDLHTIPYEIVTSISPRVVRIAKSAE